MIIDFDNMSDQFVYDGIVMDVMYHKSLGNEQVKKLFESGRNSYCYSDGERVVQLRFTISDDHFSLNEVTEGAVQFVKPKFDCVNVKQTESIFASKHYPAIDYKYVANELLSESGARLKNNRTYYSFVGNEQVRPYLMKDDFGNDIIGKKRWSYTLFLNIDGKGSVGSITLSIYDNYSTD